MVTNTILRTHGDIRVYSINPTPRSPLRLYPHLARNSFEDARKQKSLTTSARGFQLRKAKSKMGKWRTKLLLSILTLIILIVGIAAYMTDDYLWRLPASHGNSQPRALVMDQLSLNYPDPSFTANITNALKAAGYSVDYSGPTSTAVDLFRQLPKDGYDLIIMRAHSGSSQSIITSEPYSQSEFVADQLAGRLVAAQVDGGPLYFAVTPKFVKDDMAGRFSGSTIIVMGCSALEGSQDIASAFLDKGANFFVGWDSSVSIIHTDTSTVEFVRLLSTGRSLPEATAQAGVADPVYGARLRYLDWNTLVQSRTNNVISKLVIWVTLAALVVVGPMAVFVGPKLFTSLDQIKDRIIVRRKKKQANNDNGTPRSRHAR